MAPEMESTMADEEEELMRRLRIAAEAEGLVDVNETSLSLEGDGWVIALVEPGRWACSVDGFDVGNSGTPEEAAARVRFELGRDLKAEPPPRTVPLANVVAEVRTRRETGYQKCIGYVAVCLTDARVYWYIKGRGLTEDERANAETLHRRLLDVRASTETGPEALHAMQRLQSSRTGGLVTLGHFRAAVGVGAVMPPSELIRWLSAGLRAGVECSDE